MSVWILGIYHHRWIRTCAFILLNSTFSSLSSASKVYPLKNGCHFARVAVAIIRIASSDLLIMTVGATGQAAITPGQRVMTSSVFCIRAAPFLTLTHSIEPSLLYTVYCVSHAPAANMRYYFAVCLVGESCEAAELHPRARCSHGNVFSERRGAQDVKSSYSLAVYLCANADGAFACMQGPLTAAGGKKTRSRTHYSLCCGALATFSLRKSE
jgi:hypothetical protein